MNKLLAEKLAELSTRAKNAETILAAAAKETHDKIAARREQAHAAAKAAVEKVNQEMKSAGESAGRDWKAVKAKIAADANALKAKVAEAKQQHDIKHAQDRADRLEWEASFAIEYAIAAVEQAGLAALDAVDSRVAAEKAKQK
jgi:hypothetical protein